MKKRLELFLFILLLVGVAATQIYLSSQAPTPSFDSYLEIRQVDSIANTGFPLSYDELSYQGRTYAGGGLFHYLCFVLSLVIPTVLLFKYGGILFLLLLVLFSYLITRHLFPTKGVALLTTTLVASSTVFLTTFANTLSSELVFAVFFLAAMYTFLRFEQEDAKPWWFIALVITSTFISSLSLLFVVIFLLYFALLRLENFSIKKKEFEAFLVCGLFVLWFHLLMYKKVLFSKGAYLLSQSIPVQLVNSYFQSVSFPLALSVVGLLPLLLGLTGLYMGLFGVRHRKLIFLSASILSFGLLVWFALLPFQSGLFFLVLTLSLISGLVFSKARTFFKKTTLSKLKVFLVLLLFLLLVLTWFSAISYAPVILTNTPSSEELKALDFLSQESHPQETILSTVDEGHVVAQKTNRKVLMDTEFMLAPGVQQRYEDVQTLFLSQSELEVKRLLQAYDVSYVYYSAHAHQRYGNPSLFEYMQESTLVYNTSNVKVFKIQW